jgi:hypothetical protein
MNLNPGKADLCKKAADTVPVIKEARRRRGMKVADPGKKGGSSGEENRGRR